MINQYLDPFTHDDEPEYTNLDHLRDHLQGVLDALYVSGDAYAMESCLDELCHQLGVTIPMGDPVMERKRPESNRGIGELQPPALPLGHATT